MALNRKGGKWPGGYISVGDDGRPLYVIEKMLKGARFHVSTGAHDFIEAGKQLERFLAAPRAYQAHEAPAVQAGPVYLTSALVLAYRDWMLSRPHPASRRHANEMAHRLADWTEDLAGVDLRRASLRDHLKPAVERRATCRQHRIIALKGFYAWLRQEKGLLTSAEDASLDLAVPQATPEKHHRRKAVALRDVRKVLAKLKGAYRDCLLVLAATGWHVSELERFVRDDEARVADGAGKVLGVLQVRHKSGETTRTPVVDAVVLQAAKRLRERREVPRKLNAAVHAACDSAKVERFTPGVMRHSVATWAIEAGQSPEQVAEFLGHKSKSTTLKFYADVAVPTVALKTPKLL